MERFILNSDKVKGSLKIAFLSDLHNRHFGKNNSKLIEAIKKEKPDLVLVGGDMITARLNEDMTVGLSLVKELAEDYPIYYGIGNHEHRFFRREEFYPMRDEFLMQMDVPNIKILQNESVEIEDKNIVIHGSQIDRIFYKRFAKEPMDEGYLDSILGEINEDKFNILLAHNPAYTPEYALWGADLTLCGHYHGGLMRLPLLGGVVSPMITLFPDYDGGVYNEYGKTILVSRGLGTHTLPIRVFNPGELNIIEIN